MTRIQTFFRLVLTAILIPGAIAQNVTYEGNVQPNLSMPGWSGNGSPVGAIVLDPDANSGTAYEFDTVGSQSWQLDGTPLADWDHSMGWTLRVRHLSIANSGGPLERDITNDDSDHLRVSDGEMILFIDFRPDQVRISSDSFKDLCANFNDFCRVFEVPEGQYSDIEIRVLGNDFVATVNDSEPFFGQKSPEPAGGKRIAFGNSSASANLSSLARWDFIRLGFGFPPEAICQDILAAVGAGCVAHDALIDAGSFDPDGGPVTLDQSPMGPYRLGDTAVSLTVTDGSGSSAVCSAIVTVVDASAPVPENSVLADLVGQCSAHVSQVPTAKDNCCGTIVARTSDPLVYTQQGEFEITWLYTDGAGNSSSQGQSVRVEDTTKPEVIDISAMPDRLWPPNHKMKPVLIDVDATDNCHSYVRCRIVSVGSNEPVNGQGDGDTEPDWRIVDDLRLLLRAERAGGSDARIYTIEVVCSDQNANDASATVQVIVAQNR